MIRYLPDFDLTLGNFEFCAFFFVFLVVLVRKT